MTAVQMRQRHSCYEMLLFVWASNLEGIFHRVVFLRLLGWGSFGFLLHDKVSYVQTGRVIVFFPSVWRIVCGGAAASFSSRP